MRSKKLSKKLSVYVEYTVTLTSGVDNIIDIAIVNERDRGLPKSPNRIVGIETEIRSNQSYIQSNYDKFKTFVGDKESRVGALIQLLTDRTNISDKKSQEIFAQSEKDVTTIKGLSYTMRHFEIYDERTFKQKAEEVLSNGSFKQVLNKFVRTTHGVRYK